MGAHSRKVIEMNHLHWLAGLVEGDGYLDDRHSEIYNSSTPILKEVVASLQKIGIPTERIKVDVYGTNPSSILKWSKELSLPEANFRLKKDLSPWKANVEKLRVRVASKKLATRISGTLASNRLTPSIVRGLFDAEASVDIKGYVEFKQVASEEGKKLVERVYQYLMNNGISCTKPRTKLDKNKMDSYFYVKDLKKLLSIISFIDIAKLEKARNLIRIKKEDKDVDESTLLELLKKPKSMQDLMMTLGCSYSKIQPLLNKGVRKGVISKKRVGLQFFYTIAISR